MSRSNFRKGKDFELSKNYITFSLVVMEDKRIDDHWLFDIDSMEKRAVAKKGDIYWWVF